MEEIPGKRAGSRIFLHEGFSYHKDTTSALQNIYRCSSRATTKCRGTVKIDRAEVHIVHRHHGHLPNPVISQENQMKSSVLQLCRETLRSFDEIFREMSVRYPQAALNITLLSMRRTMERERAKNRPVIPAELRLLDPVLSHHPSTRQMYCGMAMGTDHSIALIFARRSMLDRLNLATELFVDFTFKVAPRKPKTLQVLIIHIRRMGVAFPVLYGLCSRKTTAMYVAIWRFVLDLAPGMRLNLSRVTSDFEKAIINSVRRVFPGIETRGCWFHLCQALRRMWLKLGLRRAPRESLFMAMCIPLAPATRFVESIDIAEAVGNRIAEDFPAVTRFFRYMRTQWAPLAEVVAVGSTSLRTNNICETFHRYIVGRLGGAHPNIWLFVEKIDELMSSEEINWQRVEAGRRITRGSSPDQVEVDARIFDLQHQLLSGSCTLEEFLHTLMRDRLSEAIPGVDG